MRRTMTRILALALAVCLGCGSSPGKDEFTGVWTDDGTNTLEFVSPNVVVWSMTRKTSRSYQKDGRRMTEKNATTRAVRIGLYRREGDTLTLAWISGRGSGRSKSKATVFELTNIDEQSLQMSSENGSWNESKKDQKGKRLELTLKRSTEALSNPAVGLWQSTQKQKFEARLLTQNGVLADFGKASPFSHMEGSRGTVHYIQGYQTEETRMEVKDLNWIGYDGQKSHTVYWQKDGSQIAFLSSKEKERGLSLEEGLKMKRVGEALSLDTNRRIKWTWPEEK